jgi:hypothetical protein
VGGAPAAVTRGGLLFRVDGKPRFLSAELALRVTPRPQIARIPGAPPSLLGLAQSDGVILPVIELGVADGAMIICALGGAPLGLVGATDIVSGVFPASGADGVLADGVAVPALDVEELCAPVRAVTWSAGWGR